MEYLCGTGTFATTYLMTSLRAVCIKRFMGPVPAILIAVLRAARFECHAHRPTTTCAPPGVEL